MTYHNPVTRPRKSIGDSGPEWEDGDNTRNTTDSACDDWHEGAF